MRMRALAATLGLAAAATVTGVGSAHAADYTCYTSATGNFQCNAYVVNPGYIALWAPWGTVLDVLPGDTLVTITCWYTDDPYTGEATDGFWDHTIWNDHGGSEVGHVDDNYINFDGLNADQVGLPHC